MTAIYKRELHSFFCSMTGYVFIAIVVAFIGIYFMAVNLTMGFPYFAATLSNILVVFVLAVPLLTMKCLSDERRSKTDQLLLTAPVSTTSVILGKYFAMMTVFALPLFISCLCPMIICWSGNGSFLIDYSAIFAYLCLGFLFVAIGMFISSLTESQIIAAVATMGILLVLYMWNDLISFIPGTSIASLIGFFVVLAIISAALYYAVHSRLVALIFAGVGTAAIVIAYIVNSNAFAGLLPKILDSFSISSTIMNFSTYYVFDVRGILMYLSVAALFVFLTVQSIGKRRWN